jgi:type I restriction enzyme M protein
MHRKGSRTSKRFKEHRKGSSNEKAWGKLTDEQRAIWLTALQAEIGKTHPFAWAQTFADSVSAKSTVVGRINKTFVKALTNALGVRDPKGEPVLDANGLVMSDPDLSDFENVPLSELIEDYFAREVIPHVPDAYIDETYSG